MAPNRPVETSAPRPRREATRWSIKGSLVSAGAASDQEGRLPRRVSAYSVNWLTTSRGPFWSAHDLDPEGVTLVRMHPVSIFDDIMGRPGPKKRRLQRSMDAIGEAGSGVIVMLMRPLPGSADADATPAPSGGMDLRTYGIGAQILADLGVHAMELLTPTHSNIVGLEGYGLSVVGERPIPGEA